LGVFTPLALAAGLGAGIGRQRGRDHEDGRSDWSWRIVLDRSHFGDGHHRWGAGSDPVKEKEPTKAPERISGVFFYPHMNLPKS
jgi:hypothetical protein